MDLEQQVKDIKIWFASARFDGIRRVYSAREVAEQRGTIACDYGVARSAADGFTRACANCTARAKASRLWAVFAGPSGGDEENGY